MSKKTNFVHSLEILVAMLHEQSADGLIINSPQNRFWLLNLVASDGYIAVNRSGEVFLMIDGRYYYQAQKQLGSLVQVRLLNAKYQLADFLKTVGWKKVLIEDTYSSAVFYLSLLQLVDQVSFFSAQGIRKIKSSPAIAALSKAGEIAALTIEFIKKYATPGKTEQEVALAATIKMLELGGTKNAFDPIVASGPNGAYPHHRPTDRVIQAHEMITLDLGCVYNHYCSDVTRTWAVGNTTLPHEMQLAHQAVLTAQSLAITAAQVGTSTFLVDQVCREHLKKANLSQYFVHSTGHGLGLDVHELPNVHSNPNHQTTLANGMVITIEPGVYLEGKYGVRIEDSLVINNKSPIILNDQSSRLTNW